MTEKRFIGKKYDIVVLLLTMMLMTLAINYQTGQTPDGSLMSSVFFRWQYTIVMAIAIYLSIRLVAVISIAPPNLHKTNWFMTSSTLIIIGSLLNLVDQEIYYEAWRDIAVAWGCQATSLLLGVIIYKTKFINHDET